MKQEVEKSRATFEPCTGSMSLGFTLAMVLGLVLIGCMPGGTTSNIFTYFSKGVLALSIMMTSVSTLVAVVMVPILLSFDSGLAGVTGNSVIPAGNVAQVLLVLLVPTVIGMILRKVQRQSESHESFARRGPAVVRVVVTRQPMIR